MTYSNAHRIQLDRVAFCGRTLAEYEIAKAEIDGAIETFCNRTRRHRHLSGVSPDVFETVSNRV